MCCAMTGWAQKLTSYEPARFSFDSEPAGATVYLDGHRLGITPFSAEVKPAYRTDNAQPGMTEFQVYTANTVLIEREIAEAGTASGTLSSFSMTFRFVFPDGHETLIPVPLRWKPTQLLGYDGLSIYYPTRITAR